MSEGGPVPSYDVKTILKISKKICWYVCCLEPLKATIIHCRWFS